MAVPASKWSAGDSERALLVAAASGRTSVVRSLLLQGVNADAEDERGLSPLMLAARHNCRGAMRALVEGGADIDLRRGGTDAWPALMHAIHCGNCEAALDLLEWGADPDACGKCGYSALMMAAGCGNRELVSALLARGAEPRLRQPLGFTAMDYAIGYGHAEIVDMLADLDPQLCHDLQPARRAVVALAHRLGYGEILERVSGATARD